MFCISCVFRAFFVCSKVEPIDVGRRKKTSITHPSTQGSNSYGGYGGYTAPSSGAAPVPLGSQPTYGQPRPAAAPGADEEGVVDGICRPGGLRPQPEKQDLVDFVEAVSILDGPRVAALLEDKMVC